MQPVRPATARSARAEPACSPAPEDCTWVDLLAACLEEACDTQGERVYPLLACIIDQHMAGTLQPQPIGRWRNEAMDALLSLLSPAVQARWSRNRSSRAARKHSAAG